MLHTTDVHLDLNDIQSNVLTGFDMGFAKYLFYRLETPVQGRMLLRRLLSHPTLKVTSSASVPESGKAGFMVNVALTYQGLNALGLSPSSLDTFPDEFKQGMAKRASILGDHGDSAPARWDRPLGSGHIHVVIIIHGRSQDICMEKERDLEALTEEIGGLGKQCEETVAALPGDVEHFGFRDGISQPWIEGTGHDPSQEGGGKWTAQGWMPLKAGEFILGYTDESGQLPASPQPELLGKNGTYLVFRKLEQDVAGFWGFLENTAKTILGANGPQDVERLGALLMGRWKSGCPVHVSPTHDNAALGKDPSRNNDFTYLDDPIGKQCPLGSHVRRTNPREADGELGNHRHRIIRRGLPYGPQLTSLKDDGKERGTTFIALNASISRQFEFLQRNWINSGEFQGLDRHDRDPLIGANVDERDVDAEGRNPRTSRKFMMPGKPFPWAFRLPDFVRVRGGEYFFVPGLAALEKLANGVFSSFVSEYEALERSAVDPRPLYMRRTELTWRWLLRRPKEMLDDLRMNRPVFQIPGDPTLQAPAITIATQYDDVLEILKNHQVFAVDKYAEKMTPPRGPFVLGMENTDQYRREVSILQLAVPRADVGTTIPALVGTIIDDILSTIKPTGKLDLVTGLAWPVLLRLNNKYFGVSGPDEDTLKRWLRDIYTDLFLNLRGKKEWTAAADVAVKEMNAYLDGLIAGLISAGTARSDTVLGRLILMQADPATHLDAAGIRRNILGVTVGVVETTLKAIARTVDQLLRRPAEFKATRKAALARDGATVLKYAYEAMRFNPQNHVLYRWCTQPFTLAKGTERAAQIPPDSLVFAATLSAMFDPAKIQTPESFRLDRPADHYLFFGHALHSCLGQYLSPVVIRETVARVLTLNNLRRAQDDLFDPLDLLPTHFMLEFDPESP